MQYKSSQEIVQASIQQDFIVTLVRTESSIINATHIERAGPYTVELRRFKNFGSGTGDFYSIEYRAGVIISKVRVVKSHARLYIIALRKNENIIQVSQIDEFGKLKAEYTSVKFASFHPVTAQELILVDIHPVVEQNSNNDDLVALNYDHTAISLMKVSDIVKQRGLFDPAIGSNLRNFFIRKEQVKHQGDYYLFEVFSVELFSQPS